MLKLKEDWSLSYLLYNLCVIYYFTIPLFYILNAVIPLLTGSIDLNLSIGKEWLIILSEVLGVVLVFVFFFQLSRVLKPITKGESFDKRIPTHLASIGWVIIIYGFLKPLSIAIFKHESSTFEYFSLFLEHFNLWYLLGAFLVFVLNHVFKEGVRIYEEQKLTV